MSRLRVAVLFGVVALLAAGAFQLGRSRQAPAAPDDLTAPANQSIGPLVVESSSLDLGELWEEPGQVHTLSVHNRTGGEVKVSDVAVSCGCVSSVEPRSFSVPANGSVELAVTLDLTKRAQAELGRDDRPFSAELFPAFPGVRPPGERAAWAMTGRTKSRVTLDALALHFGERPMLGEAAEPRSVTATVHVPAEGLKVATGGGVAASVRRLDPAGNRYEITFTPDTKVLPEGPFKTTATISIVTPSGETLFGARLPVEGTVRPEASLLPARLILGAKPVGKSASGTLVLQGAAGNDVAVQQIETDSPDISVSPTTVEGDSGARAWRVTQLVSKAGDQSHTIRFVFTRAGRQITSTVIVSSFGEAKPDTSPSGRAGKEQP